MGAIEAVAALALLTGLARLGISMSGYKNETLGKGLLAFSALSACAVLSVVAWPYAWPCASRLATSIHPGWPAWVAGVALLLALGQWLWSRRGNRGADAVDSETNKPRPGRPGGTRLEWDASAVSGPHLAVRIFTGAPTEVRGLKILATGLERWDDGTWTTGRYSRREVTINDGRVIPAAGWAVDRKDPEECNYRNVVSGLNSGGFKLNSMVGPSAEVPLDGLFRLTYKLIHNEEAAGEQRLCFSIGRIPSSLAPEECPASTPEPDR